MSPDDVSRDHVVPKALGGITEPANLVFACKRCNQLKGDLTPDLFRQVLAGTLSRRDAMERNGTYERSRRRQAAQALARQRQAAPFYIAGVPPPVAVCGDPMVPVYAQCMVILPEPS